MTDLIIIGGCTGSGKSDLAIKLANKINGEIISADSMQIYKNFDIGTAKVKEEEKNGVTHHLIDIVEPYENFTVTDFRDLAEEKISDILSRGKTPIVVGGTGFYINALLYEQDYGVLKDEGLRSKLEELLEKEGRESLHKILQKIDPESAEKIHFNNVRRVLRAVEVTYISGRKFSEQNNDIKKVRENYKFFNVICKDREVLYNKINQRVDKMMSDGLLQEVRGLINNYNLNFNMQSMKGIGYKEFKPYFENDFNIEEVIEDIKQNTRNYAKRQITWFKRYDDTYNLYTEDTDNLDKIIEIINK